VPPEPLSVPSDWVGPPSLPPTGPAPEEPLLLPPAAPEEPPLDELMAAPPEDPGGEPDPPDPAAPDPDAPDPDPDAPDPDPPAADPDDDSLGIPFEPLLVPPVLDAVLPAVAGPEPLELPPCADCVGPLLLLEEPQAPVTANTRTPTPVEIRRFTKLLQVIAVRTITVSPQIFVVVYFGYV
jgi:hypothetical protein